MFFYYFIDIFSIFIIAYLTYYYYNKKIYLQLFEYFKVFIFITLSAKFALWSGLVMQNINIVSADTHSILILIGFSLNFIILFYSYQFIFKFLNKIINSNKLRNYFAKIVTLIEIIIIFTFIEFMFLQFKPTKIYIYPVMKKTFTYPYIQRFYIGFLNDQFIGMILNNDSTMDTKEILFKSFKNQF